MHLFHCTLILRAQIFFLGTGTTNGKPQHYIAPSSIAKDWTTYQKKYSIHCHFPFDDSYKPHATLYFEPFGDFMVENQSTFKPSQTFIKLAKELLIEMSRAYSSEADCIAALADIRSFFNLQTFSSSIVSMSNRSVTSDMSCLVSVGDKEVVTVNFEVKNGLGEGGKDGELQNIGYYLHFSGHHIVTHLKGQYDLAPMLLVNIIGHSYLSAFAAFRDENNAICIDPLIRPISLLYVKSNSSNNILLLARFLQCMKKLMEGLEQYYCSTLSENYLSRGGFPYFNMEDGQFKIIKHLCRHVFQGVYNGHNVIIKFSLTYGSDVHAALAAANLAPKLIYSEVLKSGWTVVIMDYIHGDTWCSCDYKKPRRAVVASFIDQVLNVLDQNNFVHGDLRAPNILVHFNKLFVIDFDWSGKEGEVYYPVDLNEELKWPSGVKPGAIILQCHDVSTINEQLLNIKC